MKKTLVFILLLVAATLNTYAQYEERIWGWVPDRDDKRDILTDKDIEQITERLAEANKLSLPEGEQTGSTFYYYDLLKKASLKKDSIKASEYLLEIDPYMFISYEQTDSTILHFLSRYSLTLSARSKYRAIFRTAYLNQRSKIFDTFRRYCQEVAYTKQVLDTDRGEVNEYIRRTLHDIDSAHARHLRRYIKENGWPSLADGSLYAARIAERDIAHYDYYLSYLKTAVLNNRLPAYRMWRIANNRTHMFVENFISNAEGKYNYLRFDVSAFKDIHNKKFLISPEVTLDILDAIKAVCPTMVDHFFVYYAKNLKKVQRESFDEKRSDCLDILDEINKVCSDFRNRTSGRSCKHFWLPNNDYLKDKEFFYIVYR